MQIPVLNQCCCMINVQDSFTASEMRWIFGVKKTFAMTSMSRARSMGCQTVRQWLVCRDKVSILGMKNCMTADGGFTP